MLWMHFDHGKSKFIFSIFGLSIRLCRGLRWQWGLKTNFKIFLKGIFVQEGSSGTHFDHCQFEIKTFPIYAPPYCRLCSYHVSRVGEVPCMNLSTFYLAEDTGVKLFQILPYFAHCYLWWWLDDLAAKGFLSIKNASRWFCLQLSTIILASFACTILV